MQADFVAVQFGNFEQFRHVGQRVLSFYAWLNGKKRRSERVSVIDGFGKGYGEGIEQTDCIPLHWFYRTAGGINNAKTESTFLIWLGTFGCRGWIGGDFLGHE